MDKNRVLIVSISFILIVTIIAYFPSLKNEFTNWDDNKYVIENTLIRDLSFNGIKNIFLTHYCGNYHPLTLITYSLEYHFFKLNPTVYHITNLLIHLFNCILVFWMIYLLTDSVLIASITSILFGVHPLHVESVAWVSERKDVLSTMFFIGSIICYIYYYKTVILKTSKNSTVLYITTLFLFVFSLLSKAMGVTLPVILLLIDYYFGRQFTKKTIIEKVPFFVLSFIFGIVAIYTQKLSGSVRENPSAIINIFIATHGLLFYIVKMLLPFNLRCLYVYPTNIISKLPIRFLISPLLVILLAVIVFYSRKYTKKIVFGTLFYFITILPVLQLFPVGKAIAADRYSYIPLIGIFYILGEWLNYLFIKKTEKEKIIKYILISVLLLILSGLIIITQRMCYVWKNGITLWDNLIKIDKNYAFGYSSRGNAYGRKGEYENAIKDYTKAIELNPNLADSYYGRGLAYNNTQQYDKSIPDFIQAIKLDPISVKAYLNLGLAYCGKKDIDKALFYLNEAIKIDPNYAEAYYNLGLIYANKNDYDKALSEYNSAIRVNPKFTDAYLNRGFVYGMKGDYDNAISDFNNVIKLDPKYAKAYCNRGNAYYMKKEYDKAIMDYKKSIELDPKYIDAYMNLGAVYFNKGEYDKAIIEYTHVIEIDPKYAKAYFNRGDTYLRKKEYDKALQDFNLLENSGYKIDNKLMEFLRKNVKK